MITHPVLKTALTQATAILQKFANQADFIEQLQVAFGDSFNLNIALGIQSQLRSGNFDLLPEITVLANGELGTANGAYAALSDEIFVSADYLARNQGNVNSIAELLLEEIGHKLDRLLNGNVDSPGDEGAIFRLLATGQTLSPQTLAGLRATDDRAVIIVNSRSISIETENFFGDAGDNTLVGTSGDDVFFPETGADTIDGGAGIDRLYISNNYGDVDNTTITYTNTSTGTITGGSNNGTKFKNIESATITTGSGNDVINISAMTDSSSIETGEGDDTVTAGAGNDALYTGNGNDNVNGGAGNDTIDVGTGTDTIDGGTGIDRLLTDNLVDVDNTTITYTNTSSGTIIGGSNNGTKFKNIESAALRTGSGDDVVNISAMTDGSSVETGEGNDTVTGGAGNDALYTGNGNDNVNGGGGDDNIEVGTGAGTIDGGIGIDRLVVINNFGDTDNTTIIYTNTNTGTITGGFNNGTKFKNIESVDLLTGFGNDVINISAATRDSRLQTGDGNDTVTGGSGNDVLFTGDGDDKVNGGAGNDNIYVGAGADIIDGGAGIDRLSIYAEELNNTTATNIKYRNTNAGKITGGSTDGTKFKNIESFSITTVAFNDEIDISAATGDSIISAGDGNDVMTGGAGNDFLYAGSGNNTINGGSGNDTINAGDGNDVVTGGSGNDLLYAGSGNNTINGGSGNDTIRAENGSNTVNGGDGNDDISITGNVDQKVNGGAGDDVIGTADGNDTVSGGTGNDSISAGNGNNNIDGGAGNDYIETGTGNDTVTGGCGDDNINVGTGTDTVDGGDGKDSLSIGFDYGDPDNTTTITYTNVNAGAITGGSNNGTKFKNIESLYFTTGSANDLINISAATGDSSIYAGDGNNTVTGGKGNDTIYSGMGNDIISGGKGNDIINVSTGIETVDGGDGNDFLSIGSNYGDTENTTITYTNVNAGTITGGSNNGTKFKNIESVDFITGSGNDVINISAATGNNTINAGNGNNTVTSGVGNDTIVIGTGVDNVDGGAGIDRLSIFNYGDTRNTTITYTSVNAGTITGGSNSGTKFKNIESANFYTGSGNDVINISATTGDSSINAGDGNNTVTSGAGNDNIFVGNGTNTVTGGAGDDIINGGTGGNIINGGTGNDSLSAGGGNDTISGGAGNDTIRAGAGNNTLSGGNDDDVYYINAKSDIGTTTINETTTGGIDTLDFSNIDFRTRSAIPVNIDLSLTTIQTVAPNLQLVIPVISLENVTGTIRNDTIKGNSLNNTLIGSAGDDLLTGGAGSDRFVFSGSNPFNQSNAITAQLGKDTITDFITGQDKIVLSKANFRAISNDIGTAIWANLAIVNDDNIAASGTLAATIIYSKSSGNLFYNQDGAAMGLGRDGGIFATLTGLPTLAASDFSIIA